jgi:AcrR family transcriptional regulator
MPSSCRPPPAPDSRVPRPRFHKLPSEQQQGILRAALEEFAAHGFNAASLNRIIDAARISKGSMYYYFDGKEDLYAYVARVELGRLFEAAGPFPIPTARTPEAFWSAVEDDYLRLMGALASLPEVAALARGWVTASASPALQQAQKEMEAAVLPWFEKTLVAGQRARAVRKDVPLGLLIALVFGMGQAMDTWFLTQQFDEKELQKLVPLFLGIFRKALSP